MKDATIEELKATMQKIELKLYTIHSLGHSALNNEANGTVIENGLSNVSENLSGLIIRETGEALAMIKDELK